MIDLLDLVREMLVLAVMLVLPLAAAALAGGIVGGLVVALTGLQDQTVAGLVRAASVVLALFVTGAAMHDHVRSFAASAWTELGEMGRSDGG
jgi:type III secretory pathway component EscS